MDDQYLNQDSIPLEIQQINDKYMKLVKGDNYVILQPKKYDISK